MVLLMSGALALASHPTGLSAAAMPCPRTQPTPPQRCATRLRSLPRHMDEEVEHMQWQLEQRSAPQQERSSRQRGQQRVFHGRSRHGRTRPAADSSSSSVDEAADQQQQQQQAYYHSMQLTPAAAHDLRKTSERLAKHIAIDGGCCVLASPAQASALTQLLLQLQLQHEQPHRPGQRQQQLLLLQPLSCAGDAAAGSELSLSLFVAWMDAAALLSTAVFDEHSDSGSSSSSRADSSSSHPSAPSSTAGIVGRQQRGRAVDALLQAAQAASTDAAAVLAAAADKAALQLLPVGAHSDPAAVAARILAAATADVAATSSGGVGTMLCLHVKEHAGAHTVAFTALALAADALADQQHSPSLGVLLVPGRGRGTHVHATASGDAALPTSQHHQSRAPADASVEVGGFGAAYYGLRPSREGVRSPQAESGGGGGVASLQHTHDLEAWLCVLPL